MVIPETESPKHSSIIMPSLLLKLRSLVARRYALALVLGAGAVSVPPAQAARIAEPDAVIYGRVSHRVGDRVLPLNEGTLVWTLRTSGPGARELRLSAQLQSLGGGRFNYQLRVPVQVLTHDLQAASKAIGVSAAGTTLQFTSITLDGHALAALPLTAGDPGVSQQNRASALRVDLEWMDTSPDSDGDGYPDAWENQHGYDQWDPADHPAETPGSTGGTGDATGSAALTLAEWRSQLFPADQSNLEVFAQADTDGDGVQNLFEYAFGLDPRAADANAAGLPRFDRSGVKPTLVFHRRTGARDLEYVVEKSTDLAEWQSASAAEVENDGVQFFRVRVVRVPVQP